MFEYILSAIAYLIGTIIFGWLTGLGVMHLHGSTDAISYIAIVLTAFACCVCVINLVDRLFCVYRCSEED